MTGQVALLGCGFVADLYLRSLQAMEGITVHSVHDRDAARLSRFCAHWKLRAEPDLQAFISALPADCIVLNLTNPAEHYALNRRLLEAGHHVYCEKPLAMEIEQARALHALAAERGVMLASAPCSVLGEAAQTLGHALRAGTAGTPRAIYAELDDGFIPQAPYQGWTSESGAPWPYEDEFRVGCTLEHAGYYLTWLIGWFGTVRKVVAASAEVLPDKAGLGPTAPDLSVATLFFENGPVTRLTCSIVASHGHGIRIFGDRGVLSCEASWDNAAKVKFAKRGALRRRLVESPFPRRIRLKQPTHPKVKRWGAAAMNFMLGPAEMLDALRENRPCRLSADFALHLTEVTLAIQNAGEDAGAQVMTTRCAPLEPMPWAR
ncbi:Gfo/Idh/MocA family protein [Salipiger sp. PrR002]|uniref:Gfo/Idh/MocA family protein n=1 Tax=Salipiger sp. PrR002 TaxID=2706489 RepID=UPI0013B640C0|nr:Gfo/Idh/MocA family oxidoreductase [Salipiger sp. PrR002]NDV98286.1 Gfo/Idh/MocA family oxidoreductase [Salipiger sp. PrR002]NDW54998.1 Gfo/Idh/MocA family oxidoreductase [Salipiger sp. PrR004]